MRETAHATYFIDEPGHDLPLPTGPVVVRGWAVGKDGHFLTDLRARCGRRIFPALYGLPRADLAQYFHAREPLLLAGFEVTVDLAPGENTIQLEICEVRGHWHLLTEITLRTDQGAGSAMPAAPAVLAAHDFARALRLVLQRARTLPVDQAAAQTVAPLPLPALVRYPVLPFHGHLHLPPLLQRADFGRLVVEGWLFHETQAIRRVTATVDLQAWSTLLYGHEQDYVATLHPQFPQARHSRIDGFIDVPAQLPQPLTVRVYAELADGSWHLCHVQRVHTYDGETNKAPYGALSPLRFARAALALRTAAHQHGFTVPIDGWLWRALREVWTEYRARATGRHRPSPGVTFDPAGGPAAPAPRRITLITHNLNREGAPLFLLEFAAHLARQGSQLAVVSAAEGPLRSRFAALGATVALVNLDALYAAQTLPALDAALAGLAHSTELHDADLVVANTLSAYWGIHLAHRAGRRSLFYIHESTTPDAFYYGHMAPATLPRVKQAFVLAAHVSFLTETTRRYYRPLLTRPNHSLNPGWLDLAALDAFRTENTRANLRDALHLPSARRLVINLGSVCDRKGQHLFVRSVDLLWRRHPEIAASCEFLLVGGRTTFFDGVVAELVTQLNRPNLRIVPETATPYAYYGAADLFVCSSYEESFPRVLLEAMAFHLPIVSTGVHGVPEIARAEQEAVLVVPGDTSALCDAMVRVLREPELAARLAAAARARVPAFDTTRLLPRHAALASAVASRQL